MTDDDIEGWGKLNDDTLHRKLILYVVPMPNDDVLGGYGVSQIMTVDDVVGGGCLFSKPMITSFVNNPLIPYSTRFRNNRMSLRYIAIS